MVAYLRSYAQRFALDVREGVSVTAATPLVEARAIAQEVERDRAAGDGARADSAGPT